MALSGMIQQPRKHPAVQQGWHPLHRVANQGSVQAESSTRVASIKQSFYLSCWYAVMDCILFHVIPQNSISCHTVSWALPYHCPTASNRDEGMPLRHSDMLHASHAFHDVLCAIVCDILTECTYGCSTDGGAGFVCSLVRIDLPYDVLCSAMPAVRVLGREGFKV